MSTAPKVTIEMIEAAIVGETYTVLPDGRTTICQLTLDNGFTVDGHSACVSKENYKQVEGEKYSREKAVDKVWAYLGFRLADQLMVLKDALAPVVHGVERATYVGTKAVSARPMTRGAYNEYRGWTIPADENPSDLGYLVEYLHDGYVSWSPKETFEHSYKKVSA